MIRRAVFFPPLAPLPAPSIWCRYGWHRWRDAVLFVGASATSAGEERGTVQQCASCLRLDVTGLEAAER